MIIKQINEYEFTQALASGENSSFSYAGASALYDYLLDFAESIGENIQFDVIAICCEYTEYETFDEILEVYSYHDDIKTIDDLRNYTSVIEFDREKYWNTTIKGYIIQEF